MHVLFVHQNFPAQFGQIAAYLIERHGFRCTFISQKGSGTTAGIERIGYEVKGGATAQTHYCSRTFENQAWHSHGVFEALCGRPDIRPDLIVGHSGFTSTLYLRELYSCPIINYFEFFYRTTNSDIDFRSDLPLCPPLDLLRARTRNAMLLLDLENCDAGYSPTQFQRNQLPAVFHEKVVPIFDGIDTRFWRPRETQLRKIGTEAVPDGMRLVTYVSRGMESMRGFDIFMQVAKRLCEQRSDVVFWVVGEDRVAYGGDLRYTHGRTFKQWVLENDTYDLSRIRFLGRISPDDLARLFSFTDLHIYLTVPFALSWSLMDALACGATVLGSATAPVQEMIRPRENGLLCDFFDVEAMAAEAGRVLDDPAAYRHLGQQGREDIEQHYSLDVCLPQMLNLYGRVIAADGR